MDAPILQVVFVHWWKILLYIITLTLAIVSVRFVFSLDLNAWQEARRRDRSRRERRKIVEGCRHAWVISLRSPFSRCSKCQCLISTAILLRVGGNSSCVILTEDHHWSITGDEDNLITSDWIGKES